MPKLTYNQQRLITQLLIKAKRKEEIKKVSVLSKEEADLYIKDLLKA